MKCKLLTLPPQTKTFSCPGSHLLIGATIPCALLALTSHVPGLPLVSITFLPLATWPAHTCVRSSAQRQPLCEPPWACPTLLLWHRSLSCDTRLSTLLDFEELRAPVFATLEFQRKHKTWRGAGAESMREGTLTSGS